MSEEHRPSVREENRRMDFIQSLLDSLFNASDRNARHENGNPDGFYARKTVRIVGMLLLAGVSTAVIHKAIVY